jgi:RNA polymerase sigma-70 factor, ECF subfamily
MDAESGRSKALESTATLVRAVHRGDDAARERLIARCLPLLTQWAHGRLPRFGRDLAETDDLVQVSLLRALNNLESFEARRPGALLAYLRTILMNAVREEIRRSARHPSESLPASDLPASRSSVLEEVIGQETVDAYESALDSLTDKQRKAVILRIEFDMTYPEIAIELETESADAVRMLVSRGLVALARAMK